MCFAWALHTSCTEARADIVTYRIGLKSCTLRQNWPQCTESASMYRISLKSCTLRQNWPQCTESASMYRISLKSCTLRQNCPQCIESASMYRISLKSCTLRPILPQCTESASMYRISLKSCTLRQNRSQCTESASMYRISLKSCTFRQNQPQSTNRPQCTNWPQCTEWASMYSSLIGSETSHEKINYESALMYKSASMYRIGLKICTLKQNWPQCTNRPQCTELVSMYRIGLNVQNWSQCTAPWLAHMRKINYLCLKCMYIEADSLQWGQMRHILYRISLKCTESASNVLCLKCWTFEANEADTVWCQMRQILFEADSVHLRPILCKWGRFGLKCT